jgi:hypothetical protein
MLNNLDDLSMRIPDWIGMYFEMAGAPIGQANLFFPHTRFPGLKNLIYVAFVALFSATVEQFVAVKAVQVLRRYSEKCFNSSIGPYDAQLTIVYDQRIRDTVEDSSEETVILWSHVMLSYRISACE